MEESGMNEQVSNVIVQVPSLQRLPQAPISRISLVWFPLFLVLILISVFGASRSYAISLADSKVYPDLARRAVTHLIRLALFNEPRPGAVRLPYSIAITKCPEGTDEDICVEAQIDIVTSDTGQALRTISLVEAAISEPCRYLVRPKEESRQADWDEYVFGVRKADSKTRLGILDMQMEVNSFEKVRSLCRCGQGTEQLTRFQRYRLNQTKVTVNDVNHKKQHSKTVKVGGGHE
jgi:hypothetical protein